MSKKIWRGGMIGAGDWSEIQLNAWAGVKNAEIVALCDRHPERREPIVQRFDIPQGYNDFETMLDQAELDFVDICTRPYSHAPLTKLAAERDLPVLCQKPFCESLEEAQELVEFCDKAGVRLMINENFRWQAWYRRAKKVIGSGALGRPFCTSLHKRYRLTMPTFDFRQAYMAEMPRFVLYEMGVHYLDTFRFLFGEPDWAFARLHHVSPDVMGEDAQLITLGHQGLTTVINHSWASVPVPGLDYAGAEGPDIASPPRLEIDGTEGTLALGADGWMRLFSDSGYQEWHFSEDTRPASRTAAQQHFIDCLESGAEFETSGAETLKTMALVYACYLSAEEGRVVDLMA
jgi:predicted dehydrogenase